MMMEDNFNYGERFSCLRRVIVLLGLISLSLLIALVVVVSKKSDAPKHAVSTSHGLDQGITTNHYGTEICTSRECVATSWILLSKMADSKQEVDVSPCQDMYQLACGRWLRDVIPPEGSSAWSIFHEVRDDNQAKLRQLIEQNNTDVNGQTPSAVTKLKHVYRTCMELETIESQGASRLLQVMSELGHWSVTPPLLGNSHWDADHWSLQTSLVNTHKFLLSGLFQMSVAKDATSKDVNKIVFAQSGLTLENAEEYQDESSRFKDGFMSFAVKVGVLLGGNETFVEGKMEKVYNFEKNLSKISTPREKLLNPLTLYNKYTIDKFQNLLGDWIDIKDYLITSFDRKDFNDSLEVIVVTPEYFRKLGAVVQATEKETLANYLMWNLVQSFIGYLPESFQRAALNLAKVETGMTSLPERWKTCLSHADAAVGLAGSALYVNKYFSQASKVKVTSALQLIKREFIKNLDTVQWLDDVTRSKLKVKANSMRLMVGYPDWILEADKLDERYEKLQVKEGEFFLNKLYSIAYYRNRTIAELFKKPDPEEWSMLPHEVNAYYNADFNQIVVPAGILQPPFYSPHYSEPLLFGTIGMVVGHELTHGFDSSGRLFNKDGLLGDMWTPEAAKGFQAAGKCMENQYSGYKVEGQKLNGKLTLNENIADNGGFKLAWSAYQVSKGHDKRPRLPGLNFTDDQLFILGFSQLWCNKATPEHIASAIRTDPHSAGSLRVKGVLSNSNEFSEAFGCDASSISNKKCRVW